MSKMQAAINRNALREQEHTLRQLDIAARSMPAAKTEFTPRQLAAIAAQERARAETERLSNDVEYLRQRQLAADLKAIGR